MIKRFCVFLLLCLCQATYAQFHSGYAVDFGQMRIQHEDFNWSFYRSDNYDIYYTEKGKTLAELAKNIIPVAITDAENTIGLGLSKRLNFFIFNNLTEQRQTNIANNPSQENLNNFSNLNNSGNKIILGFNGNIYDFYNCVKANVIKVILENSFRSNLVKRFTESNDKALPAWYKNAFYEYAAAGFTTIDEGAFLELMQSKSIYYFNHLNANNGIITGKALFNYIYETYGKEKLLDFFYNTIAADNFKRPFEVLGDSTTTAKLEYEKFISFYKNKLQQEFNNENAKTVYTTNVNEIVCRAIAGNRNGLTALVTNNYGVVKLKVLNAKNKTHKLLYKKGYKAQYYYDNSTPVMQWHPTNNNLYYFTEEAKHVYWNIYDPVKGSIKKRIFNKFTKVLDLNFSQDGTLMVVSAVRGGQTDIFTIDIKTPSKINQITNDFFTDINPSFTNADNNAIAFLSNRPSTSEAINYSDIKSLTKFNLFNTNTQTKEINQLSFNQNIYRINCIDNTNFIVLKEINNKINVYLFNPLDSAFSLLLDKKSNILGFEQSKNSISYYYQEKEKYHVYTEKITKEFLTPKSIIKEEPKQFIPKTAINNESKVQELDSLGFETPTVAKRVAMQNNTVFKTIEIDLTSKYSIEDTSKLTFGSTADNFTESKPKRFITKPYSPDFYREKSPIDIDRNFIYPVYQPFNSQGFYINPSFGVNYKLVTMDIVEDWRFTLGIKAGFLLTGNEFIFTTEYLKNKIDHEINIHRNAAVNTLSGTAIKALTHDITYKASYPFSERINIKGSSTFRVDNLINPVYSIANLTLENRQNYWGALRLELVYDNTINPKKYFTNGLKAKVFAEYYTSLGVNNYNVNTLGYDIRYYKPLHRNLTLALRHASGFSYGKNKLLYYLGGQDNWLNPSNTLNNSPDLSQNYVFQTTATPMRGFLQNARNGSNFSLINAELRVPLITYLSKFPIANKFLRSIQFIPFLDGGTAWNGLSPFNKNTSTNQTFINGPLTVTVNNTKSKFILGYGLGTRVLISGMYFRIDYSRGWDSGVLKDRIWYISFGKDF